jgi:hypothetical protein
MIARREPVNRVHAPLAWRPERCGPQRVRRSRVNDPAVIERFLSRSAACFFCEEVPRGKG